MIKILTGVLIVAGLYGLFMILQLMFWTLIAVQAFIPWVVCAILAGYCFRKFLIYKKSITSDSRIG